MIGSLSAQTNIFFSEYSEGNGQNKYIEIYNASNETIALSDYAYATVFNTNNNPGNYEYWNEYCIVLN